MIPISLPPLRLEFGSALARNATAQAHAGLLLFTNLAVMLRARGVVDNEMIGVIIDASLHGAGAMRDGTTRMEGHAAAVKRAIQAVQSALHAEPSREPRP